MAKAKKSEIKKDQKSETTNVEKHSIPAVVPDSPVVDPGGFNVESLISQYRDSVPATSKKPSSKERPVIDLDDQTQCDFMEFAAAKVLLDDAKSNHESKYNEVTTEIFERWTDVLWQAKTQPENPSVKAYIKGKLEATGIFTISTGGSMKIDMPEVMAGETMERAMIRGLVLGGVSESNAGRLVKEEMTFVPEWEINLTDMMRGVIKSGKLTPSNDVQKNAAGALFLAIQGNGPDGKPLTAASRIALLDKIGESGWIALQNNLRDNTTYVPVLKDGDGFLDRVCSYADTREELGFILRRIKPVRSMRSVDFAVSDSADVRHNRLVEAAKLMVGSKSSR